MECKWCDCNIISRDKRQQFCNRSCAAKYNNLRKSPPTTEQKQKTSESLKTYYKTHKSPNRGVEHSKKIGNSTRGKYRRNVPTSIFKLSSRTRLKIYERLNLSCCVCGWNEDTIDIHHIVPRKHGGSDEHSNLSPLCPNHHRMAGNNKIPTSELISLDNIIGDRWTNVYYG